MAEAEKPSTKAENSNTVDVKRLYALPEYDMVVEASSVEEAVAIARAKLKQANKQEP